jgi:hypothetical protein
MRPSVSCSASGSFEASSNAFWSSFVIVTSGENYIKKPFPNHVSSSTRLLTLTQSSAARILRRSEA